MEMTAGNGSANMNTTGATGSNHGPLHVNMNVGTASTQLQQRAAAAAQYLNSGGQRQPTSRDVQLMLEKNDAAMRAWSYLHAQQPSQHLISEHKAWAHKCSALRQQIGARLEVLASLADKQIAREDASGSASDKPPSSSSAGPNVPPTPPPVASAGPTAGVNAAAKKPSRAKTTKPKVSATAPAPVQVRQTTASAPVSVAPSMPTAGASNAMKSSATAAALGFPDAPMPVSGLPRATQNSTNPAAAAYYGNANVPHRTPQPTMYPSATAASATTASTTSNATTSASTAQAFSNAPNYGNNAGYMGGMGQQPTVQANPYMNNANFMMNNAMNIAAAGMINSQYMAMQMQGQMPMAMNNGAMYNPNVFGSSGAGYMAMNTNNQLQANPFNAPFQMQQGGAVGYNPAFNMGSNAQQMMPQMGGFQPMQSPQMMFNPMAFNMTPAQQPQQQQQFQQTTMQQSAFNNNLPSQQQQQQQQQSSQQTSSGASQSATGAASSPFLDDDSNLFEGFSDDAFLNME